jgi:carbon monoxide dehydrogenase subunit G
VQLENSFTVPVPVDEAWRVLLDIERIAPCMPGAALDSVQGDDFTGRVKVKLGPINLTYQGKASFIEKDEATHKAVIDARGKDQRGNGTAAAVVTATLASEGAITRVNVLTDLNITGRPAQFGRGVMTDVGNKLLGQFADKLATQLGAGEQAPAEQAPAEQPSAAASAAATATGAVEEVAASVEQVEGNGAAATAAKKAGAATKKAAAAATDKVGVSDTQEIPKAKPAKKSAAGTASLATGSSGTAGATVSTGADTSAAATPKAPSGPPSGTTAPPTKPATGAPVRSVPSAPPAEARTLPQTEPEPIDLLEVAGGAAMARYAAPAAGVFGVLLLIFLLLRRRGLR